VLEIETQPRCAFTAGRVCLASLTLMILLTVSSRCRFRQSLYGAEGPTNNGTSAAREGPERVCPKLPMFSSGCVKLGPASLATVTGRVSEEYLFRGSSERVN
jgi:hypothetical protein